MKILKPPTVERHGNDIVILLNIPLTDAEEAEKFCSTVKEGEYRLSASKVRQKRSLNANSYYQVLVRKCAEASMVSVTEYHNRVLAEVGIPFLDEEGKAMFVLMKDNDRWLKILQGETHYAPTSYTEDRSGTQYRWFYILLPSHLMDSKQMSMLIDYVTQDAEALGIDTLDTKELDHLISEYGKEHQ